MVAHTCERVPHKTVVWEKVRWVAEMVAGEGLVGSSGERKIPLQHGGLMEVEVEWD